VLEAGPRSPGTGHPLRRDAGLHRQMVRPVWQAMVAVVGLPPPSGRADGDPTVRRVIHACRSSALAKPIPYLRSFTWRAGDSAKSLRVEAQPPSLPPCAL